MSRKRWMWVGGGIAAVAALGAFAWSLQDDVAYARIATHYAAKQTCSCLNVSGRTLDSCLADFPEEARGNIEVKVEDNIVRASVLFGAVGASANYEEGFGCQILD